jgi:hypothetical protein
MPQLALPEGLILLFILAIPVLLAGLAGWIAYRLFVKRAAK